MCAHNLITSTAEKGWHCAVCGVRLLSLSMPIPMPLIERAMDVLAKATASTADTGVVG